MIAWNFASIQSHMSRPSTLTPSASPRQSIAGPSRLLFPAGALDGPACSTVDKRLDSNEDRALTSLVKALASYLGCSPDKEEEAYNDCVQAIDSFSTKETSVALITDSVRLGNIDFLNALASDSKASHGSSHEAVSTSFDSLAAEKARGQQLQSAEAQAVEVNTRSSRSETESQLHACNSVLATLESRRDELDGRFAKRLKHMQYISDLVSELAS